MTAFAPSSLERLIGVWPLISEPQKKKRKRKKKQERTNRLRMQTSGYC
jgi:hypothetical protein